MKRCKSLVLGTLGVSIGLLFTNGSLMAFECTNAGAGTGSNDNGTTTATACGPSAAATLLNSTALGYLASASGNNSSALGKGTSAAGNSSTAVGEGAEASGSQDTAVGSGSTAQNGSATAIGTNSIATGFVSTVVGQNAQALSNFSSGIGHATIINGVAATTLGALSRADFNGSTAVGYQAATGQANSIVLGAIQGVNGAASNVDVGIGTNTPMAPLHVSRDDGTALVMVEETAAAVQARTLFALANPGNTKFEIINTDAASSWAFTNSGNDFRVSRQGSGVVEFLVDNNGNAFVAGDLTVGGVVNELSDRNAKTNVAPVNPEQVLEKVAQLPISQWSYKSAPDTNHIGPMAQDFRAAFGTGQSDTTLATMDVGGVAIASIQALKQQNMALRQENEVLKTKSAEHEQRLALLEQLVAGLLPRTVKY